MLAVATVAAVMAARVAVADRLHRGPASDEEGGQPTQTASSMTTSGGRVRRGSVAGWWAAAGVRERDDRIIISIAYLAESWDW